MKKKIKLLSILLVIVVLWFVFDICFISKKELVNNNIIKNKEEKVITTKKKTEEQLLNEKIDNIMNNMSIEQKIGQMIILNSNKNIVDNELKELINNNNPGGFILMKDNITTYDNTKKFVSDLKENTDIPLIISIDEEGGNVQRLRYITDVNSINIPYMYYLGKTNNESLAYRVGEVIAEELKTIGVNVVYAPVVDIYSNKNNTVIGKRSFGENKDIVSLMANSVANGIESKNVIPTYKHFPGHGDTDVDSHTSLPIINKTYEELKELELTTFSSAINNNAKLIMVGHIALPNITGDNTPATLSKKLITDILKNDMKYDGLVITDALNMGALTKTYTNEEIYIKVIDAGVDILLMPKDYNEAIDIIKNNISEERINESVKKILYFKYKFLKDEDFYDKSYLTKKEHQDIIDQIKY